MRETHFSKPDIFIYNYLNEYYPKNFRQIHWDPPGFSSAQASTTAGQADVAAAGRGMLDAVLRVGIPGVEGKASTSHQLLKINGVLSEIGYFYQ